jgi:stage II sporulation protein R
LEEAANTVLASEGFSVRAKATLQREAFDTRHYDTFSLPAGVYNALRITIGEGAGQNWWCVVFPGLCIPATAEEFADTAVGSGFDEPLTGALQQEKGYEIRFFLLDWLGKLQNFFFGK